MQYSQNDVFIEQLVTRRKGAKDYLLITLYVLLFALILFLLVYFIQYLFVFAFLIVALSIWLLYLLITNHNIEYEYILTNGTLDIDIINNKRKRKRKISADAKDMEIVASLTDTDSYKRYSSNSKYKKLDLTSNSGPADVYFFTCKYKEENYLVIFEPEERILKELRRFNPRNVKYNMIQG